MSLSSSLSNAVSGLTATSRAAQIVSSNLSNALNENYGRRSLELTSEGAARSGGVSVAGVVRHVDPVLLADGRAATSALELAGQRSNSLDALSNILGTPDDPASISGQFRRFESSLEYAENNPAAPNRLLDVVQTGKDVVQAFKAAQSDISDIRTRADTQIDRSVNELNDNLQRIVHLNTEITAASVNGRSTAGFKDQRQELIDKVSAQVPVREFPRAHGAVSLVSAKGMVLLDGSAVTVEFTPSNTIMPHMTTDAGLLGEISVDGTIFDMSSAISPMAGGALQGLFAVRDETSIAAQMQLDALALEFSGRFTGLSADATIGPGVPGVFTDAGAVVDAVTVTGLAGRLQMNSAIDPAQGGEPWRIRDGLGAIAPGAPGNTDLITQMLEGMTLRAAPVSSEFPMDGTLHEFAATAASDLGSAALSAAQDYSFASAHNDQLLQLKFAQGVDTDAELQRLLAIETNYAANAKVIQTIDDMLSAIMRIG